MASMEEQLLQIQEFRKQMKLLPGVVEVPNGKMKKKRKKHKNPATKCQHPVENLLVTGHINKDFMFFSADHLLRAVEERSLSVFRGLLLRLLRRTLEQGQENQRRLLALLGARAEHLKEVRRLERAGEWGKEGEEQLF